MRSTIVLSLVGIMLVAAAPLTVALLTAQVDEPIGQPKAPPDDKLGPVTEKRFPSLVVPEGFKATLFACDPLVEYPSVISIGPAQGTLFIAHDYVTGLGVEIVRRDEIRLVSDTNGDGYADKSLRYAGGFNSIQGLAYHAGSVYVMHAPLLTSLADIDGDGVADQRRDLIEGLGLPPEENSNRLHCANGVAVGHDGWLYLALGDRGCDVERPEGDRLLFQQGGILRCRTDGRDLHVFADGLRNIYDVALDEELNVFVRDNENDGGDYMIRVCHCFHGSDHGYPYLYYERPAEAMLPLADLGRGSSAGVASYLETAFPGEYGDSLYFCEWGRAVVRYPKQRAGSSFSTMAEVDFAAGADTDPYGFKPTDVVVDYDGSLLISDWADGQRPKRGRARIYRIEHTEGSKAVEPQPAVSHDSGFPALLAALESPGSHRRIAAQEEIQRRGSEGLAQLKQALDDGIKSPLGRMHAIWVLAQVEQQQAMDDIFAMAESDDDPAVRAQAVRALADLADPVLAQHKLAAGRGDPQVAERLVELVTLQDDSRLLLEVLVALGRLRWSDSAAWLSRYWPNVKRDPALNHAAMQLLRRSDNWPAVLQLLDSADDESEHGPGLHELALLAIANQPQEQIVDGLLARLQDEKDAQRRAEYADALARVYKKPARWTYWGFRPPPRPAHPDSWEKTGIIETSLDGALADPNPIVRLAALVQMRREAVPVKLSSLSAWLKTERDLERASQLLEALGDYPAADVVGLQEQVLRDRTYSAANRLTALAALSAELPAGDSDGLLEIGNSIEEGPVLAALLAELGSRPKTPAEVLLLERVFSSSAIVRAAAVDALTARKSDKLASHVVRMLEDDDAGVRRSAAVAAGVLQVVSAAEPLRGMAFDEDRLLVAACLVSLKQLRDPAAVPQAVVALKREETRLEAISYLESFGSASQLEPLEQLTESNRSMQVLTGIARALSAWQASSEDDPRRSQAIADALAVTQVRSGTVLHVKIRHAVLIGDVPQLLEQLGGLEQLPAGEGWLPRIAAGLDAGFQLLPEAKPQGPAGLHRLAVSDLLMERPGDFEFLGSCNRPWRIWLNGREVFQRDKAAKYSPNSERFEASLKRGRNRLIVEIKEATVEAKLHLRFRPKSSKAEHERLIQLALAGGGSEVRGREVFLNAEKSQCIKCHRLSEQKDGRIGPDLTGIGSRFSRIHLIESILEPSRTVAPSYATIAVAMNDGQVLTGVRILQTEQMLVLGDNQGKLHTLSRSEIDDVRVQTQSTMPEGLEKRLTDREFLDLLAFLTSQTKK